jgi:pilus assembly protein Flp/PilA
MLDKLMVSLLCRFARDEDGAALVEYGILIALIAAVVAVAVQLFGTNLSTGFNTLATNVSTWFGS